MRRDVPEECEVLVRARGICAHRFVWYLLELVRGEIGRVCDGAEAGDEGGVDVPDTCPIDPVEKRVMLNLINGQTVVGRRDQPRKPRISHGTKVREESLTVG